MEKYDVKKSIWYTLGFRTRTAYNEFAAKYGAVWEQARFLEVNTSNEATNSLVQQQRRDVHDSLLVQTGTPQPPPAHRDSSERHHGRSHRRDHDGHNRGEMSKSQHSVKSTRRERKHSGDPPPTTPNSEPVKVARPVLASIQHTSIPPTKQTPTSVPTHPQREPVKKASSPHQEPPAYLREWLDHLTASLRSHGIDIAQPPRAHSSQAPAAAAANVDEDLLYISEPNNSLVDTSSCSSTESAPLTLPAHSGVTSETVAVVDHHQVDRSPSTPSLLPQSRTVFQPDLSCARSRARNPGRKTAESGHLTTSPQFRAALSSAYPVARPTLASAPVRNQPIDLMRVSPPQPGPGHQAFRHEAARPHQFRLPPAEVIPVLALPRPPHRRSRPFKDNESPTKKRSKHSSHDRRH